MAWRRSLWRSAAPARALLVARGRAFVLEERGGRLGLAARAARAGRPARTYDLAALSLSPWASLAETVAGRGWTEFRAAARLSDDALEIGYGATRRPVMGFPGQTVVGQVEGVIRVGLDSGRVTPLPGPAPAPPPITEPAPPRPGARLVSIHARAADTTLVFGGPPANVDGALIVGDRRLRFELAPDSALVRPLLTRDREVNRQPGASGRHRGRRPARLLDEARDRQRAEARGDRGGVRPEGVEAHGPPPRLAPR